MNSLRENVRVDQLVFRHVKHQDIPQGHILKQFRDFVRDFVLFKIPAHTRTRLVFRGLHQGSTDLLLRGHYDDMLPKRTLDSIRKLFLSFTIVDLQNATTQTGGHHVDANSMRKSRFPTRRGVLPFYDAGVICEHLRLNTILHVRDIAQAFFDSATPEIERVDSTYFDRHTKLLYMRSMTSKDFSEALFRISLLLRSILIRQSEEEYKTGSLIVNLIKDLWTPLFEFVAPQKPCEDTRVLSSLQRSALNKFKDAAAHQISSQIVFVD